MRSFIGLKDLLFCGLLVVAHGGVTPTCIKSGQCPAGSCCVRDPWWNDANKVCAPLGSEYSECNVTNEQLLPAFKSAVFSVACPCQDGYVCKGLDDSSQKGICVKPCKLNEECPGDRCCATLTIPSARDKRDSTLGTCRKLGTANETCYVDDDINDVVNFLCPCATGFICQGSGEYEELDVFTTWDDGVCVPIDTNDKAIPGK